MVACQPLQRGETSSRKLKLRWSTRPRILHTAQHTFPLRGYELSLPMYTSSAASSLTYLPPTYIVAVPSTKPNPTQFWIQLFSKFFSFCFFFLFFLFRSLSSLLAGIPTMAITRWRLHSNSKTPSGPVAQWSSGVLPGESYVVTAWRIQKLGHVMWEK